MKVCDLCTKHPLDADAQSGGDVRSIVIDIEADVPEPLEHYKFDACGPCRRRIFGEIFENIAPGPPAAAKQVKDSKAEMWEKLREMDGFRPRTESGDGSGARWPRPSMPPNIQVFRHAS
jgi:hypothetical protein